MFSQRRGILVGGTRDDGADHAGHGTQGQENLVRTFGQVAAGERHAGGPCDGRRLRTGWRDPAVRRAGLRSRSLAWDFMVPGRWPDARGNRRFLRAHQSDLQEMKEVAWMAGAAIGSWL